MFVDYYHILEIPKDANDKRIKAAYREQAFLYHPDRNSEESAHQRFVQINEAYRILSDPQERQKYDRLHDRHHGKKIKGGNSSGFESLERTRAKRASRYNRSMYNQRMRYRGASTSPSSSNNSSRSTRQRPPTRPYSSRYEKIVMEEAEASQKGFSSLSKVLRILCIVGLIFSIFLIVDKNLAIEKAQEVVLNKEEVPWSFTQPNVVKIKTKFSSFGVQRSQADMITIGDYVKVKKSLFGDVPVEATFEDYDEFYRMETYGCRYDSPFELIWIAVIMCTLALFFQRNPQSSTYLSTVAIFVSLNIFGIIFMT